MRPKLILMIVATYFTKTIEHAKLMQFPRDFSSGKWDFVASGCCTVQHTETQTACYLLFLEMDEMHLCCQPWCWVSLCAFKVYTKFHSFFLPLFLCMNAQLSKWIHTDGKVISHIITEVRVWVLRELWSVQWWKHFKIFNNMPEKDSKLQMFFSLQEVMCPLPHKSFWWALYKKESCTNIMRDARYKKIGLLIVK